MAITNPTSIFGPLPANIKVSNAKAADIPISHQNIYTIYHSKVDEDGNGATGTVYLAFGVDNTAPTSPTAARATNTIGLASGETLTVGPGLTNLSFISASGSPVLVVSPKAMGA